MPNEPLKVGDCVRVNGTDSEGSIHSQAFGDGAWWVDLGEPGLYSRIFGSELTRIDQQPEPKASEAPIGWHEEEIARLRAALSVATKALERLATPITYESGIEKARQCTYCHRGEVAPQLGITHNLKCPTEIAISALSEPAIAAETASAKARAERHSKAVARVNELTANLQTANERIRTLEEERNTYEKDIRVLVESGCQQATQLAEQGWRIRALEEVAEAARRVIARSNPMDDLMCESALREKLAALDAAK